MTGIIFIAFNLRPALTSIGPLISNIRIDTGISNGLAGLLITLPLIAFGVLSPFAPRIAEKLGYETSMLIGLCTIGAGIVVRSTGMLTPLFAGTILIGLGIGLCNVLLPGIVKRNFPNKVGLLTGIYTLAMGVFAGIAPGLSVPFADQLHLGWKMSLGIWSLLVLAAIIIWIPQLRIAHNTKQTKENITNLSGTSLWKSVIAWQVTLFMGLQSLIYFSFSAWLPEILHSHGLSIGTAGWLVTLLQFAGLPANFIIPIVADRLPNQKGLAAGIGICCLAGLSGILYGGNTLILTVCIILTGIGLGASISHALTLIGLRAANAKQAADLSGMAQSVGYLLAALGPLAIGFLFDFFHTWTIPLIMLIIICILMTVAGVGAGRNRYVLEAKQQRMG